MHLDRARKELARVEAQRKLSEVHLAAERQRAEVEERRKQLMAEQEMAAREAALKAARSRFDQVGHGNGLEAAV